MDFSKVKSIVIPEGNVSKITIANKVVWQKDDSPYTELPYLVAIEDSPAWIDTGIPYQNGCKVELKITYKNNSNLFGIFYTAERMRLQSVNNTVVFNTGTGASTSVFETSGSVATDAEHTIICQANPDTSKLSLTVDGKQQTSSIESNWLLWNSTPNNIYVFAINRPTGSTITIGTRVIHYFKYWDVDGNLLLDLVPVERKSDGVLGMLNKVDNTFLTNATTGSFYKEIT